MMLMMMMIDDDDDDYGSNEGDAHDHFCNWRYFFISK